MAPSFFSFRIHSWTILGIVSKINIHCPRDNICPYTILSCLKLNLIREVCLGLLIHTFKMFDVFSCFDIVYATVCNGVALLNWTELSRDGTSTARCVTFIEDSVLDDDSSGLHHCVDVVVTQLKTHFRHGGSQLVLVNEAVTVFVERSEQRARLRLVAHRHLWRPLLMMPRLVARRRRIHGLRAGQVSTN